MYIFWQIHTGRGPIIAIFCLFLSDHLVHPFKYPVILNVTLRLTLDGNIFNFPVHAHIRDPLKSCWFLPVSRKGAVPIIAISLDVENDIKISSSGKGKGLKKKP